jgi:ABC-type glycerol-3-phosphate transport system permease component
MAFAFLLNPGTGPVNVVLGKLGLPEPGWFNDPTWSKPALTMLALWGIGDLMVIFMAALLDVPTSQYEAAGLDGAGRWATFRFITLPNISPIVLFAVVTGIIQTMQYYTQPLIAGRVASGVIGGSGQQFEPGYPAKSTLTLPQLIYNLGFQRFDTGSASVVALVLFALSMPSRWCSCRRSSGQCWGSRDSGSMATRDQTSGCGRRPAHHAEQLGIRASAVWRWDRACTPSASRLALLFSLPFAFIALTALMSDQQTLTPRPVAADPGSGTTWCRPGRPRASAPGGATPSAYGPASWAPC